MLRYKNMLLYLVFWSKISNFAPKNKILLMLLYKQNDTRNKNKELSIL